MKDFKGSGASRRLLSRPREEHYENSLWQAEILAHTDGPLKGGDLLDATLGEEVRTRVPLTKPAGPPVNSAAKKPT
jgi:hypothetical protein